MDIQKRILGDLPLDEADELDVLLEFAQLVREMIGENRDRELRELIRYTVRHGYLEALYWALGILDETYGQTGDAQANFECMLGGYIPRYNDFISRLGVDLNAFESDIQKIPDENGEVQSFFQIIKYRTAFDHLELRTRENFDARDNDYIQYLLFFHA